MHAPEGGRLIEFAFKLTGGCVLIVRIVDQDKQLRIRQVPNVTDFVLRFRLESDN